MQLKSNKHTVLKIFIAVLALVCIALGILSAADTYLKYKQERDKYTDLSDKYTTIWQNADQKKETKTEKKESEFDAASLPAPTLPEDAPELREVDFTGLHEINEDVVGWIDLPAVELSYPIMQGTDNNYYLHRNINKEESFAGSIFMDSANSSSFQNFNTVIYGHNMRDGSMFAHLKDYQDQEIYASCPYFWVYTPDAAYLYKIFSVRTVDVSSDVYTIMFPNQEAYIKWLSKIQKETGLEEQTKLQNGDRVVTLSTCTGDDAVRQIVQGVLIRRI